MFVLMKHTFKKYSQLLWCLFLLVPANTTARLLSYRGGGNNGPTSVNMISDLQLGYSSATLVQNGATTQGHGLCWSYGLGAAFQQGSEGHHRVVSLLLEYNGYDAKYTDPDSKNKTELLTGYVSLPISYFRTMSREGHDLGFYYMATAIPQYNVRAELSGTNYKANTNPFLVTLMASAGFGIPARKPYAIRSYMRSGGRGYFTNYGTETRYRYAMIGPYVSYNVNNMASPNLKPALNTNLLVIGLRYVVMIYDN